MAQKNILLLESVSTEAHRLLETRSNVYAADAPDQGGLIAEQHPIHAIVTRGKGDVSDALIRQCPQLEVIARCGVGLDNVDVEAATQQGVKVINAPGSNADTVAEHTLALMLCLQRHLYTSVTAVKQDRWEDRKQYAGDEIRGKTLGILGMGNIGKKVARLATAFGMQVVYWRSRQPQELPYPALELEELLRQSDIVSVHLPLTEDTRHLLDRAGLAKMQPHALLINTARGDIIDQQALTEALRMERLAGFAADVLAVQPPAADDLLLQMPQVLVTPHAASLTARTYNDMCVLTVQNTLALLAGDPINDKYIFNLDNL